MILFFKLVQPPYLGIFVFFCPSTRQANLRWPLDDLDEEIKDEVCECDNEVDRKRVRL